MEALGEGVSRFAPGQRVALAHHVADYSTHFSKRGSETMDALFKRSNIEPGGFAEVIRVPALHVNNTVVAVPDHVPFDRAVFMEPMPAACGRLTGYGSSRAIPAWSSAQAPWACSCPAAARPAR